MSKISIKLNKEFKSFKNLLDNMDLEGDLIILTGINGSGKSQLLDILAGRGMGEDDRMVSINGSELKLSEVSYKSFKEVLNVDILISNNADNIRQHMYNIAWGWFATSTSRQNYQGYSRCREELNSYFLDRGSIDKLTDIDTFKKELPHGFNIYPDDAFTNSVYNLFHDYLFKEYHNQAIKGGADGEPYELPQVTPWDELDQLFRDLNFSYKFKKPEINQDLHLAEYPLLIGCNGLELQPSQLSDGEKAILTLAVGCIGNKDRTKLLLLDEYDATFNPSLTEAFYKILDKFFIKEGVTVILTTHNPVTVTFAPTNLENKTTSFYELNKDEPRLNKNNNIREIEEIKNVLIKFYPQVGAMQEVINELQKSTLPILFVEGKTDKTILENAYKILYPEIINRGFEIISLDGADNFRHGCNLGKFHEFKRMGIFLNDRDDKGYDVYNQLKPDGKDMKKETNSACALKTYGSLHAILLPIPENKSFYCCIDSERGKLSIENLFEDEKIYKYAEKSPSFYKLKKLFGKGVIEITSDKEHKPKFADSTKDFEAVDFTNFKTIFETIQEIIKPKI